MEVAPLKTTTDGVFTVTVGGAAPAKSSIDSITAQLDVGGPSPRMNAGLVLVRHNLYIFGGSYEQGKTMCPLVQWRSFANS